jgi:hypothetical protein
MSSLTWNTPGEVTVINKTTINQSVGPSSISGIWRIASLKTPTVGTQDFIEIRALLGNTAANNELTILDYIARNRFSSNQYTRVGPPQTVVGLERYQEADGSASIYAVSIAAGSIFWSINWSITFSNDAFLFIPPDTAPDGSTTTPTGTLVWSTMDEATYPPLFHAP